MSPPLLSRKQANWCCFSFLVAWLSILSYTKNFWPGVFIALISCSIFRQYMRGRRYDMMLSCLVLTGLMVYPHLSNPWQFIIPVMCITASIYLLFREFLDLRQRSEESQLYDANQDIEDKKSE